MSTQQVIHVADLRRIEGGLDSLRTELDSIASKVTNVADDVTSIDGRLARLANEFAEFVRADQQAKQLQLAETRLVKVRQQLEHEFGHYGEVRRRTTGILQATDAALVRQDTINTVTEELMLAAPRYWLAPALVALAAWLADHRELAGRAATEAERRDREKTTLFFALVCRRLARFEASSAWINRFFSMQDPTALLCETVVMIDAVAAGVFGGDARAQCARTMERWIAELSIRAGFVESQRDQWKDALLSRQAHQTPLAFPYLAKQSATWPALQAALQGAGLHETLCEYFDSVFSGQIPPAASIIVAVDDLLDKLVTEYDAEELPLRRDERLLTLIIEADGDRDEAQRRSALEQHALAEHVSFTQLLTNAAMHPETSHASRETQRYAIALSRQWISDAHQDLTAANRASVPLEIRIGLEGWEGVTRNGSNESELLTSLDAYLARMQQQALDAVKLGALEYGLVAIGGLMLLCGFVPPNVVLLLLGFAAVGWLVYQFSQLETRKQQIREQFAKRRADAKTVLQACLAEVVDWRKAYAAADARTWNFEQLLAAITPEQYVLSSHDRGRAVLNKTPASSDRPARS